MQKISGIGKLRFEVLQSDIVTGTHNGDMYRGNHKSERKMIVLHFFLFSLNFNTSF